MSTKNDPPEGDCPKPRKFVKKPKNPDRFKYGICIVCRRDDIVGVEGLHIECGAEARS